MSHHYYQTTGKERNCYSGTFCPPATLLKRGRGSEERLLGRAMTGKGRGSRGSHAGSDTGHFAMFERLAEFNRIVLDHLGS
jgi:hypothetical protein